MASLTEQVLRRKPVTAMTAEAGTDSTHGELRRSIGLFQLTLFGVGATIGTGIFIVLTQAVPVAGPAVIWSFVMAGAVAGLTAICYAELASAVPVSGSSYSYAYATLGEGIAMVVAACLLLEYGVSAAAVAVGWSQYLNELFDNLVGFTIPKAISQAPEQGGIFNLPAVLLIWMCTALLIRGASESAKVNAVMVLIKVGVLILFIAVGVTGWDSNNLSDFSPFGLDGITSAAGIIFFSYIGLDAVSTAGEEVKDPRRNMPLAIIASLIVVTSLYVLVTVVAVSAQPFTAFEGQDAGLSAILEQVTGSTWPATVLAAGAVVSIFSVTLVVIYGQTRILFAMGRDGMIPSIFHRVNPRTLTPVPATIIVAVIVSLLAGVLPINFLAEMTSIGTLVAFLVVSVGVMVLRYTQPNLPRGFKVPLFPVVPILSILGCFWIIKDLRFVTIAVFVIWASVAMAWYFSYGIRNSTLGKAQAAA
jgi:APA family basic amino acid/polyamine antiporter